MSRWAAQLRFTLTASDTALYRRRWFLPTRAHWNRRARKGGGENTLDIKKSTHRKTGGGRARRDGQPNESGATPRLVTVPAIVAFTSPHLPPQREPPPPPHKAMVAVITTGKSDRALEAANRGVGKTGQDRHAPGQALDLKQRVGNPDPPLQHLHSVRLKPQRASKEQQCTCERTRACVCVFVYFKKISAKTVKLGHGLSRSERTKGQHPRSRVGAGEALPRRHLTHRQQPARTSTQVLRSSVATNRAMRLNCEASATMVGASRAVPFASASAYTCHHDFG